MTQPWTVVIADDEELSRRGLRGAIDSHPRFRVIGEAVDGSAALGLLDQLHPDLAFLDVEMPGLDGFDVLRALRPRDWPMVVFVTGYDDYAVEAFEVSALDYLLKPWGEERMLHTLEKAANRLDDPDAADRGKVERMLSATRSPNRLQRLPIRHNGKIEVLDLVDVDWISAAGNYVELHTNGRRLLHRITLKMLADRIDPHRFARIHRSTIVNVERVRELQPTPQGDWKLALDTGDKLRLSRRYRAALDLLLPDRHSGMNGTGSANGAHRSNGTGGSSGIKGLSHT
ncbi:DNA-binding response regulator [bacterium]|nr:MAG: DNA-binding response regulator [bacterium]RKZ18404.1 MAG: DNA-binding response regulator [bacterium]